MSETTARRADHLPWQLWALVGTIVAIELLLSASDRGWLDPEWRTYAILNGAFWRPVATGAVAPLFDEQWLTMYASHAFLHGGIMHVALNSTVLLALGKHIAGRAGAWSLIALFVVSAVAGALGFQVLSTSNGPMVGASGAVFGFLGLWLFWDFRRRRQIRTSDHAHPQNGCRADRRQCPDLFCLQRDAGLGGASGWVCRGRRCRTADFAPFHELSDRDPMTGPATGQPGITVQR